MDSEQKKINEFYNTFLVIRRRRNYAFGSGGSSPQPDPAVPIGDLLRDDFDRASLGSEYTAVGTSSATITSNELVLGKATAGAVLDAYIYRNDLNSMLNNWYASIRYRVPTLGTSTTGLAVGTVALDSVSPTVRRSISAQINLRTNSANYLKLQAFSQTTLKKSSVATLAAPSAGDILRFEVSMQDLLLTYTVTNETTAATLTDTYQFTLNSPDLIQTRYCPMISVLGSTWSVLDWTFGSNDYKNVRLATWGDSTMQGVAASNLANTPQGLYEAALPVGKRLTRCALGSTTTADLVACISNAQVINAEYNLILMGSNDKDRSVSNATVLSNLQTFAAAVNNAFIISVLPRNSVATIAGLNTTLSGAFGGQFLDAYPLVEDSGSPGDIDPAYDSGDGTHFNDAGNAVVTNFVISQVPQAFS